MRIAITRKVSPAIGRCELTHLERTGIDAARAAAQHEAYERCLERLGCRVVSLPAEPELPDSVFVEDAAVVVAELAVITRPGAASRRAETASVAAALAPYRPLATIQAPATLDGGDVLVLGRRVVVGRSSRSDPAGIEQLRALLVPHGFAVEGIPVRGCLHLKSAVTWAAPDTVLLNPEWVDRSVFAGLRCVEVAAGEAYAANGLLLGDALIYPRAFPRTAERLAEHGIRLERIDVSELAKAEGAVTCCSVVVEE
ncbi:MAG: arginine deiminase family protein [Acidobacteriota bacterium]